MDRARLVNYPIPDPRQKRRMDREGSMMLAELVNLPTPVILEKLRQLENLAHILGQQEMNELTRAEVLNILWAKIDTHMNERISIPTNVANARMLCTATMDVW